MEICRKSPPDRAESVNNVLFLLASVAVIEKFEPEPAGRAFLCVAQTRARQIIRYVIADKGFDLRGPTSASKLLTTHHRGYEHSRSSRLLSYRHLRCHGQTRATQQCFH